MKSGKSHSSYQCPHCGKFSKSSAGAPDDDEAAEDPAEESAETPQIEAAEEAQESDPTNRARSAVRAKLKAIEKRDGKR